MALTFVHKPKFPTIFSALFLVALGACRGPQTGGGAESYVENGVAWAYGSIDLMALEAPAAIMLKRQAADQTLNTTYTLYGAAQASTGNISGQRDLAYSDLHPTYPKMLAYAYSLDVEPRDGNQTVDVYALLKRAGRSYYARQKVFIGTASFQSGSDLTAIALGDGLKISLIANGPFSGQWALHYPDAPHYVTSPWQGMCPKTVTQMPGQNPNQTVGQLASCKPLPAQNDLCSGDPTKEGCRPSVPTIYDSGDTAQVTPPGHPAVPLPPANIDGTLAATRATSGLDIVDEKNGVYQLSTSASEAKVTFVSTTVAVASEQENAGLCATKFLAVARTVGREVNSACVIKPAPAALVGKKLTCAVTVSFNDAQTYMEKVCNVTASFRGAADERQAVQILKH